MNERETAGTTTPVTRIHDHRNRELAKARPRSWLNLAILFLSMMMPLMSSADFFELPALFRIHLWNSKDLFAV